MLLDLTTLALELVADITETSKSVQKKDPEEDQRPQKNCLVVIELDHMRDRRRYIDCLRYSVLLQ